MKKKRNKNISEILNGITVEKDIDIRQTYDNAIKYEMRKVPIEIREDKAYRLLVNSMRHEHTNYDKNLKTVYHINNNRYYNLYKNTVLNEISREYKNKVITIDKKPAIIMISLSHDQPERVEIQAEHRLLTKVNVNIIVYENYFLANDFKMTISGEEIPFSTLSIARNVETVADGRKMIDQRFLQNTSGCTIGLSAPFMNTPMSKRIVKDISKAGSFSEVYHLTIKHPDYDDLVLVDGNYIFSTGTIQMEFGSIISYTAQFILASDIK